MSFKAKLKIGDKVYNVLHVSYDLAQETDPTGHPSAITRGGRVHIVIESTGDTSMFEWMTNNFEHRDGSIVFIERDTDTTLKELTFSEAYMIKYKENFDGQGRSLLTEDFVLSAKSIRMGTGEHVNDWVELD